MPRVSVIIPCYNREVLLCATLDSVRAQTFCDWEAIVVDDRSQDNSLGVAQRYGREDDRIRAARREADGKGANICRNQGLSLARGEYVVFLDSDDLLWPGCLEHRVADMDKARDCGFGVYQTELFTLTIGDRRVLWNAFTEANDLHRFLSFEPVWLTSGPIWRKQVLAQLGGFDENLLSLQDWALHVRALIAGIKYFKAPMRDNFHRFEYDRANTMSAIAGSHPDHLRSHEELFAKTLHDLQAAGLLDRETRGRMAGLFWWQAMLWRAQANLQAADRVWSDAHNLGLCNRRQYLEGRMLLRLYCIHGTGRVGRLIQWFWPLHTWPPSKHLHRAPVGRTEPEAASANPSRTDGPSNQARIESKSLPDAGSS